MAKGTKIGELFFDIRAGIQSLQKDLNEGKKAIATFEKNATKVFSTIKNTLLVGAAIAAPILAIKKFGDAITDLAQRGEALGDLEDNFKRLGGTADALNAAKTAVLGTVSAMDLMKVANEGLIRNIPQFNEKFGQMAEFAQRFADATGRDTKQVLEELTAALAKGKTKGLEPFGFALEQGATKAKTQEAVFAQLQTRIDSLAPSLDSVANAQISLNNAWTEAIDRMGKGVNANELLTEKFRELQQAVDDTNWEQFGNDLATIYAGILDIATKALPEAIRLVNDFALALEYLTGSTTRAKIANLQDDLAGVNKEIEDWSKPRQGGKLAHAAMDALLGTPEERLAILQKQKATLESHIKQEFEIGRLQNQKKVEDDKATTETALDYRKKMGDLFNETDVANSKKSAEKKKKDAVYEMDDAVEEFYKLNKEYYKKLEEENLRAAEKMTEDFASAFDSITSGLGQLFDQMGSEGFGNLASSLGGLLEDTTKESILSGLADALGISAGKLQGIGNAIINTASDWINAEDTDRKFRDNRGTGQAAGGTAGAAIGAYFGNAELGQQIGAAFGSEVGKLFGRGSQDPDEMARSSFARFIEDKVFELKTIAFYNQNGQLQTQKAENFNFVQGGRDQFNDGKWAEDFKKHGEDAQQVFTGLGEALKQVLGITEDVAGQFSYLLGEQLLGNIDNARLLVQQLGFDIGTLEEALVSAAKKGDISWQEFSIDMAGLAEAFKPGLAAAGDLTGAWDSFVNSAGRGQAALKAAKDIGVEAVEKGAETFDQARQLLIQAGKNPEEVNAYFDALLARGIATFEQLAAAEDKTLGAAIGDAGNNSEMLSETWKKATEELENYATALNELPEVKVINLKWQSEIDSNTQSVIDSGVAGNVGLDIPNTTVSDTLDAGTQAAASKTGRSLRGSRRGGSGGNFNVYVDATGANMSEESIRRVVKQMEPEIINRTMRISRDRVRRGGSFSRD